MDRQLRGNLDKIHMDDMARKIFKEYEELTHGTVKEWTSPGYPIITLTRENPNEEIIDEEGINIDEVFPGVDALRVKCFKDFMVVFL